MFIEKPFFMVYPKEQSRGNLILPSKKVQGGLDILS